MDCENKLHRNRRFKEREQAKGHILLNKGTTDVPPFANGAQKFILFFVIIAEKCVDYSVNSLCIETN